MKTVRQEGMDVSIQLKDYIIYYDDYGTGELPVIFIHGFPFDKSSWQNQIDFLKKTNRVIAFDIRGFGKSTPGSEKASIGLFADDLIEFMNQLGIDKAIVCGLSMGGYILLNALHQYPDRFAAIILSDTQCISDSPEAKEKRNQTIKKIESGGLMEFTDGFVKNIFCKKSLESKFEIVEKIRKKILTTSSKTITGTLSALALRKDTCFSLSGIHIPTLILLGKEDVIIPKEQIDYLHQNIINSKIHIIEEAGHLPNIEQPDEFNEQLMKFISDVK